MRIPQKGGYYSVNEANASQWVQGVDERLVIMKQRTGLGMRYVGAMVADIHRTLLEGGCVPLSSRIKKLRWQIASPL